MIGNWLETLNDEQLGRLLTTRCVPAWSDEYQDVAESGVSVPMCLMEVAWNVDTFVEAPDHFLPLRSFRGAQNEYAKHPRSVWNHYDDICRRFGIDRINAAIRNRCLRILAGRSAPSPALAVA